MPLDYNDLPRMPLAEFEKRVRPFGEVRTDPAFRLSSSEELDAAEQMLDLRPGTLRDFEFYSTRLNCAKCQKPIGIDDFVKSSILDAGHAASFVAHTLLGRKRVIAQAKPVSCASCGEITTTALSYNTLIYACEQN